MKENSAGVQMNTPQTEPKITSLESMDVSSENRASLKALFPSVFTETINEKGDLVESIDFEKLKAELGTFSDLFEGRKERYGMEWPGKKECLKIIQQPSLATLKPCREESVNFDTTENLFIEGDNLEVLKLLQKSYYGKVKMIYIDPPYNTGKEFIYPDHYAESLDTYLAYAGLVDDKGKKFSTNTANEGRFHTKWLNMMYPRLYIARNLLREDGVIFISIDGNEVTNLRKLCDEIFGEENFFESIIWNKRIPKNDEGIGSIHEYILIYVKNKSIEHRFTMPKEGIDEIETLLKKLKDKKIPLPQAENEVRELYSRKGYDRGITLYNSLDSDYKLWGKINVSWPNAETNGPRYEVLHPKTKKPVKIPERGWRWKKETFDELLDYENCIELHNGTCVCGKIWFDKDEKTQPSLVKHLNDVERLLLRSIVSLKSDGGITVESLFENKNYYSYPKPVSLIELLIQSIEMKSDDIVLDFFSGSCTTAQAIINLNMEDGISRKFIMVQLPERCDSESEAHKAGFRTLADIGKERIRRVIRIKEKETPSANSSQGFKVLKLDKSNFKVWEPTPQITVHELLLKLEGHIPHIDPKASQEDILYELLLKSGYLPTAKIEKQHIAGKIVYSIGDGVLMICLESEITREFIEAVATTDPERFICLDHAFKGNDQLKANAMHAFSSRRSGGNQDVFRTI